METKESRGSFTSGMGFILATAGSAVGLGNLWRFPYLAEEYGGGAFVLVYLLLALTFGVSMLITEVAIGRRTGKSCFGALLDLNDRYPFIGWLAVLIPMFIGPYYCVIGGWVTKYTFDYATGSGDVLASGGYFGDFISASLGGALDSPVLWFLVFAVMTLLVVYFGVEKGIERFSKILMPALFVLLIVICVYMLTLDGIVDGLRYYIVPDLDDLSFKTLAGAMGQLFYSLSLAMGITITYGSYMRKKENIEKSAYTVVLIDSFVAFMSGLMVVPAVIVFSGADISSGPGLMFETMPLVFDSMPAGHMVGAIFFLLALFAAISSSVSIWRPWSLLSKTAGV